MKRKFGGSHGRSKRRRFGGKRRYTRRRRVAFRGRRPRRTLLNIVATKKSDQVMHATATDPILSTPNSAIRTGATYFMHCPSYRDKFVDGAPNDHQRESTEVFFKGWSERVTIRNAKPLMWRRIVFWSFRRLSKGIPYRYDSSTTPENVKTYKRRGDYYLNDAEINSLFNGTVNLDFTAHNRWMAPLDRHHCRIVSDRTTTLNPGYDLTASASEGFSDGVIRHQKFWYGGKQGSGRIIYEDQEAGSMVFNEDNGWSSYDPKSKGNLYVMDIFSQGWDDLTPPDERAIVGTVEFNGTSYWHEK